MKLEEVRECIYELAAMFFQGATVIWAEQIGTKPKLPYVTLKTSGMSRSNFPIVDEESGNRYYNCSTILEINVYTKGKPVTIEEGATGNYANTSVSDLMDFFYFLDSDGCLDNPYRESIDIALMLPIRDLSALQNDSRYRYRSMAEATVSFVDEANGHYGIGGMSAPNSSGGGTPEMAEEILKEIKDIEIVEEEGGNEDEQ